MRAYGFYWVRIREGDGEAFVAEFVEASKIRRNVPSGWHMPGSVERFSDRDIEVLGERLVPPTKARG